MVVRISDKTQNYSKVTKLLVKPNFIQNTELKNEQLKDETEIFNSFINVMVQIVEKYGKTVLQELDCAA